MDDEHDRDVDGVRQRAIAFADVHRLEAAAVLQAALDRLDSVRRQRRPHRDAGDLQDLGVRDGGVPVHPYLADDLLNGA